MGLMNLEDFKNNDIEKVLNSFWDKYEKEFEYVYTYIYSNLKPGSRLSEFTIYLREYVGFNTDTIIKFFAYALKMNLIDIKTQSEILTKDIINLRLKLMDFTKLDILCIKLRDCNSFEEYKKIVEIDGLKFIKSNIPKIKLKILSKYADRDIFYRLINYIQAVTLYMEVIKYNIFPKELLKYRDIIFRYDYLDNGYIACKSPERYLSGNNEGGELKLISRQIENNLVINNTIPNSLVLNGGYHGCLANQIGINYKKSTLDTNIKVDKFTNDIINRYDRYIMEASIGFENLININQQKIDTITNKIIKDIHRYTNEKDINVIEDFALDKYIEYLDKEKIVHDGLSHISTVMKIGNIYKIEIGENIRKFGWNGTKTNIKKLEKKLAYMHEFTDFYARGASDSFADLILSNLQELMNYIEQSIYSKNNVTVEKESKIFNKQLNLYIERLKHIESYKELSKLAQSLGYNKVRQSGDHGIFKKNDGSIVVIPQGRKVGKGLSLKIQKDIKKNI